MNFDDLETGIDNCQTNTLIINELASIAEITLGKYCYATSYA